jgi:site-specific DNA-methyltransferase (cytosine-N4-specific)
MSTLALEALLEFKRAGKLRLIQQFIVHNPARLPSPAQWVNVERIRVKDSFTHIWWLAPSDRPYADNRSVLTPYSVAMKGLLKSKRYNAGPRPSEHRVGKRSFLKDNGGAIASNVLSFSNTSSNDAYQEYCRKNELKPHPARMQREVAAFFVKFLTRRGDMVLDPFAGSNTTGAVAEVLRRKWVSIEANRHYIRGSRGRFSKNSRVSRKAKK